MLPKRLASVCAALIAAFLINSSVALENNQSDWPQSRFSPPQTGYNPFEYVLNPSNVSNLTLLWSDLGIGPGSGASPVVANGVVYVANGDAFEAGSNNLYAFVYDRLDKV
jgi:outer membrane protein assembly factor BamB